MKTHMERSPWREMFAELMEGLHREVALGPKLRAPWDRNVEIEAPYRIV